MLSLLPWNWSTVSYSNVITFTMELSMGKYLVSCSGCRTESILGCLSLVSWATPLFSVSRTSSRSPYCNFLRLSFQTGKLTSLKYWCNMREMLGNWKTIATPCITVKLSRTFGLLNSNFIKKLVDLWCSTKYISIIVSHWTSLWT